MKKIICLLLAASLLFLCGCSADKNKNSALSPELEQYLSNAHNLESIVHEYGEEQSHLLFSEKLVVGVYYPETGIEEMDRNIEKWVQELVAEYQTEVASYKTTEDQNASELTVSYESRLIDERLVSVKMSGFFDSRFLAHPVEIIKTFNADKETGEMLDIKDVVDEKGCTLIYETIAESENFNEKNADENILSNWLVTKDSFEVVLSRGEYFPMSDGTKTFSFEFEKFKDHIKLFNSDKTETEPEDKDVLENNIGSAEIPEKQNIDVTKPMLALTFDDGPSAHTERLLDIFSKYGGKGTFFVVGNIIDNRPDTVKRIVSDGHEIAGHSWSHRQLTSLDEESIRDQIMSTRAKIYSLTGYDAKLMRPPYGAYNDTVKKVAQQTDIALINWSVDTLDWKYKNADTVCKAVLNEACDGAIILCHDLHKTTVDAMEKAIPALIEKGYQLVTVSELMEAKGKNIEAGKVYFRG